MIVPGITEDAFGISLRVLELTGTQRPHKGAQPDAAQTQRNRNQNRKDFHRVLLYRRNRNAFRVTVIELADIASAASNGVARPAIAMGTATML